MQPWTKQQKGSPSRDLFKYLHKNLLHRSFYALNSDLELVNKNPPFIVARLDFKVGGDCVSFSEAIAYNQLVNEFKIPVYIIEANYDFTNSDPSEHLFYVYRYNNANWRPNPPVVDKTEVLANATWQELGQWERELRKHRIDERKSIIN